MNPLIIFWIIAFPLSLLIYWQLEKHGLLPLSKKKFISLWIPGLIFFMTASFLTGQVLPTGKFIEHNIFSRIVFNLFGVAGLYLKILIIHPLLLVAKIIWSNKKIGDFYFFDYGVLALFIVGLFDVSNDILKYPF